MIRTGVLSLFLILLFASCQNLQKPTLIKVEKIKIDHISTSEVKLNTEVLYHNPNPVAGHMDSLTVEVYANDVFVSNVIQSISTSIPSKDDFTVPVHISIPVSDIIKKDSGFLGGLLNALTMKKIKLKYVGVAKMNIAKVSFSVPFEYEEEVEVSL